MSDGVKGPNRPTYTSSTPPPEDQPSSPVISPKPQIPRTPGKAPKSILKNRTVKQATTTKPQVNKKAREKMELVNKSQNLVAQLESLLPLQQFMAHKDVLMEAIANPEVLPEDFTIVYIDEHGWEVTVIPPDPQLHSNHEQETLLRNELKARVCGLDELFNDDMAEKIDEAILITNNQLEECSKQLMARQEYPLPKPEAPQQVCLDFEFLTASPKQIPPPSEDVFVLDERPVARTFKKQRFNENEFSAHWLKFYSSPGEKIPGQFHTLEQIRQFSDDELETTHDFIQLLFPNKHVSAPNPGAPLLTDDLAETIQKTPALMNTALQSVDQMLAFWGLERSGHNVTVNSREAIRHSKWDGAFDHNHQRITRMLDFLMACGQYDLAINTEQAMQSQRIAKQQGENPHWARAVGRELYPPTGSSNR